MKVRRIFYILFLCNLLTAQIFVSTDGSDSNSGSFDAPFATIIKALTIVTPGDTIFVRGGTYTVTSTIAISSSLSGIDSSYCYLLAYNDEKPILDFSAEAFGSKGISLRANYWKIKGLNIAYAGDNGLDINGGSYNIINQCNFYENRDSGVQLGSGAAYNQIINCDSYYNADPPDYGDADGFAPKLTVGTGNFFYGCRSWGNCDDGWDGYLRGASDMTTTLINCWTWGNGYLKDGTDPGSQANGNGFKMGGGDDSNSELLMHHFNLTSCLAFQNKNKGFDQNNNVGSMILFNCSGWANLTANYRIKRTLNEGQTLIVKNCVSYEGSTELGGFAIQETNSWMGSFNITDDDFISIDPVRVSSPRKMDGSLPDIDFLHLASGSDLIDAGVDIGLSYLGDAPDLGAFESNYTSRINQETIPLKFALKQNYPNPFNPTTTIEFSLPFDTYIHIFVVDIRGNKIVDLVNAKMKSGNHNVMFNGSNLASGVYYYQITAGEYCSTRKMILLK